MELLLAQPDISESENVHHDDEPIVAHPTQVHSPLKPSLQLASHRFVVKERNRSPLFVRYGPFVSLQEFRQQHFQPNLKVESYECIESHCPSFLKAIRSLKEMGFQYEPIITALRMFNNDQNLSVRKSMPPFVSTNTPSLRSVNIFSATRSSKEE